MAGVCAKPGPSVLDRNESTYRDAREGADARCRASVTLRSHLRVVVILGVATALITETLSAFGAITRLALAVAWAMTLAAMGVYAFRRRRPVWRITLHWFCVALIASIAAICGVVLTVAIVSPPNSADAMAYHLPRVLYWAQNRTVRFFPTTYFNQVMLQPLDEYAVLQTFVLTGGDRFANLIAFGSFVGSIFGVAAIAREFGVNGRGMVFAALFCATLPNAILQASGAKNDSMLGLWLVCAVLFALRRDFLLLALSVALALGTKATAYLFAPPVLAAVLIPRLGWRDWARLAGFGAAAIALIDGPQYARNIELSGSPLGYDSAFGNGTFRWRNERFGWKATVSNALRHLSDQLGGRSEKWNNGVYEAV